MELAKEEQWLTIPVVKAEVNIIINHHERKLCGVLPCILCSAVADQWEKVLLNKALHVCLGGIHLQ